MNRLYKILFASFFVVSLTACQKNNLVIDKDPLVAPGYAELLYTTFAAKSYFITEDPTSEFKIPIGVTNVSNEDRTIQLTYKSATAVQGTQFTAPASITIPAGKVLDTLRIKGIFANYPTGRRDIVTVKITGGSVPAFVGRDSVNVILQKYCNVVLNNYLGDYTKTRETLGTSPYGPYNTVISSATSTGPTTGRIVVENIFDYGWGPISFDLNWTDPNPANFRATVVTQSTGIADAGTIGGPYAGQQVLVRPYAGQTGTFNSCDQTFTLKMQLGTSGGTWFSELYTVTLAR